MATLPLEQVLAKILVQQQEAATTYIAAAAAPETIWYIWKTRAIYGNAVVNHFSAAGTKVFRQSNQKLKTKGCILRR